MIRHPKITTSEPRKAAMRSSKVTFSQPQVDSQQLEYFAAEHCTDDAD
jgi:hypothetical protein